MATNQYGGNGYKFRIFPSFAQPDPAAGNVVVAQPPDLLPIQGPNGAVVSSDDIGVGGRYAEQLRRNRQLQGLDPTLTPTEDFFVDEIVRRVKRGLAVGGGATTYFDPMRYIDVSSIALSIGVADQMVLQRPANKRVYLYINNTHATQRLFVTFGTESTALLGVPIEANLGWFEWIYPVPQNDVHLIANGAATTAVLMYGELPVGIGT